VNPTELERERWRENILSAYSVLKKIKGGKSETERNSAKIKSTQKSVQ